MEEEKLEEKIKTEERVSDDDKEYLDTDDFVRELSTRAGFTMSDTKVFLKTMREIFEDAITEGVPIIVRGLFSLSIQTLKPFRGVNARKTRLSGEIVHEDYPEGKRLVLSAAINLRDLLREPEKRKIVSKANKEAIEKKIKEQEEKEE
jgi:hypothetical protein